MTASSNARQRLLQNVWCGTPARAPKRKFNAPGGCPSVAHLGKMKRPAPRRLRKSMEWKVSVGFCSTPASSYTCGNFLDIPPRTKKFPPTVKLRDKRRFDY